MQLNQLKPKHKLKKKKRIGRGGKRGTYSGRGVKGQKARAGAKFQPMIREVIKRYPKLRGYRQKGREKTGSTVNLEVLEKKFKSGEKITPQVLLERKIIRKIKGRVPQVKILGRHPPTTLPAKGGAPGELKKKLIIEGCKVSKAAAEKIKKAGGTIKSI